MNLLVVRLAGRTRRDAARRLMNDEGKLIGAAMNGLRMVETLKATGSESEFFGRWAGHQAKALKSEQALALVGQLTAAVPPLLNTLGTAAVLLLGGLEVIKGTLTVGMLVAYQSLMASFLMPLGSLLRFGASVQELEADMNRLDDVLDNPEDRRFQRDDRGDTKRTAVKLSGLIEVRGLTFGYSPLDPPLIEDFDLQVTPGQRVALVGPSGCGKSTIARLIAGLYEPWDGEILFDGRSHQEVPSDLLSNSLALVDQNIFLFEGSVRDNLTLWDATVPPATITKAGRDASIHEDVQGRAGGYEGEIEEGGRNFSGGQRQRLEIARALSANPTMLILDEATSALDPTTEAEIDDSLRRRGCSCIIVAHRLSTIRDCDEIVVLEQGRVVQRGTHAGMKDQDGLYSRLIHE